MHFSCQFLGGAVTKLGRPGRLTIDAFGSAGDAASAEWKRSSSDDPFVRYEGSKTGEP
jgi:hypothetical protein